MTGNPMENSCRMMQIHCILRWPAQFSFIFGHRGILIALSKNNSHTQPLVHLRPWVLRPKQRHSMPWVKILYINYIWYIYYIYFIYIYIYMKYIYKYNIWNMFMKYFDGNWCKPLQCQAFKRRLLIYDSAWGLTRFLSSIKLGQWQLAFDPQCR